MISTCLFDFDSTLVQSESLDLLLLLAGSRRQIPLPEFQERLEQITDAGMEGKSSLRETIEQRLLLARPNRSDLDEVNQKLRESINPEMKNMVQCLHRNEIEIHIVSGGFHELIEPTAQDFAIVSENIFANRFRYRGEEIVGFHENLPACQPQAKVKFVKEYKKKFPERKIILIGDGYTDLETQGLVDVFIGFGVYKIRKSVMRESLCFVKDMEGFQTAMKNIWDFKSL